MKKLTRVQKKYMAEIRTYHAKKGYAPSVKTLTKLVGNRSTYATREMIRRLIDKGYLKRRPCPHCGHPERFLEILRYE